MLIYLARPVNQSGEVQNFKDLVVLSEQCEILIEIQPFVRSIFDHTVVEVEPVDIHVSPAFHSAFPKKKAGQPFRLPNRLMPGSRSFLIPQTLTFVKYCFTVFRRILESFSR